MADFLTGPSLTQAVTQITQTGKAKLAVAFWGSNACELLQLPEDCSELQIICDAFSGACNPDVISTLNRRGADVRCLDTFHAKVYLGKNSFVVGSANASANGLGQEAEEIDHHLEAGFLVSNVGEALACERWFDGLFKRAKIIESRDLDKIRQLWLNRRNTRPKPKPAEDLGFVELFLQHPEFLLDRRMFSYCYKDGETAERLVKIYNRSRYNNLTSKEDGGYNPFYYNTEGWDVVPGDIIMDFALGRSKVIFTGFWEVRGRIKKDGILAVRLIERPFGIEVSKSDWKRIQDVAQRSFDAGKLSPEKLLEGKQVSDVFNKTNI